MPGQVIASPPPGQALYHPAFAPWQGEHRALLHRGGKPDTRRLAGSQTPADSPTGGKPDTRRLADRGSQTPADSQTGSAQGSQTPADSPETRHPRRPPTRRLGSQTPADSPESHTPADSRRLADWEARHPPTRRKARHPPTPPSPEEAVESRCGAVHTEGAQTFRGLPGAHRHPWACPRGTFAGAAMVSPLCCSEVLLIEAPATPARSPAV